jgi:hypothetical protein
MLVMITPSLVNSRFEGVGGNFGGDIVVLMVFLGQGNKFVLEHWCYVFLVGMELCFDLSVCQF